MSDDAELRLLLRSPALTLEPPSDLPAAVRSRARRHRLRARAGGGLALVTAVAGGLLLGPSVADSVDGLRNRPGQSAGAKPDPRAPDATSEVVTLQTVNGAQVLTWFEGADWCTGTTRVTRQRTCLGPVDPNRPGFSRILPSGSPSLTVDDQHVVAGVLPPEASRVLVHMKDGREYTAQVYAGRRFVLPVWWVLVDDSTQPVEYYAALDQTGKEIYRKPA